MIPQRQCYFFLRGLCFFFLAGLYGFGGFAVYSSVSVFMYATIAASSSALKPIFPTNIPPGPGPGPAAKTFSGTAGAGQQLFARASSSVSIPSGHVSFSSRVL